MLLSYEIVNGKKILYISSGYWHLQYHGDVEYSGHIFKYTQNGDTYDIEELNYNGSFFDFKDGNLIYTNTDRDKLFFNSNEILTFSDDETIYQIMYNGMKIAINTRIKIDSSSYEYYSYTLSINGNIEKKYKDGYFVLTDNVLIFIQNRINPKKLIVEPLF